MTTATARREQDQQANQQEREEKDHQGCCSEGENSAVGKNGKRSKLSVQSGLSTVQTTGVEAVKAVTIKGGAKLQCVRNREYTLQVRFKSELLPEEKTAAELYYTTVFSYHVIAFVFQHHQLPQTLGWLVGWLDVVPNRCSHLCLRLLFVLYVYS
jgi:hypothetical protein